MEFGFQRRSPQPFRDDGLRIRGRLPAGVVMCLCCGPLPVSDGVALTAGRHTKATAHPTAYAPPEPRDG
jgi:hypothetical protein